MTDLKRIAARFDIDWSVLEGGFEDDAADAEKTAAKEQEDAHAG